MCYYFFMKKFLFLLLLLVFLFISSSQTYEQQSLTPTLQSLLKNKPLEDQLAKIEVPYGSKKVSMESKGYYGFIEFFLRKSAHFIIFGLVAVGIYSVLRNLRYRYVFALLSTLLLAALDEYHQHLTGGRTPSGKDVLLDMAGAFTFLTLLVAVQSAQKKSV